VKPPFDLALIDRLTPVILERGYRIMQTHRYHQDDLAHVTVLLGVLDPPEGAWVLDAGCGIGEVSRLMHVLRPDLTFAMANVSEAQLACCPVDERLLPTLDDCHALPEFWTGIFDAVMFNSSLCQMDEALALAEAARILKKPGGILLLNELIREVGEPAPMEQALACRTLTRPQLRAAVEAAGFRVESVDEPAYDDTHFRELLRESGQEALADGVRPVLLRAVKA
jgi:SAM-dependent methyltransferase